MNQRPIQGEEEILLVASCYRKRNKLRPDGPLGSYADCYSKPVAAFGTVSLALRFRKTTFVETTVWSKQWSLLIYIAVMKEPSIHFTNKASTCQVNLLKYIIYSLDIPRIRKGPPSSFTAKEGSNVSFPCSSKGFPKPDITWYKNNQKLDSNLYNAVTGVLTFPSIQFGDRGLYRCEAKNFLGFDSTTVKIVVEGIKN